MSVAWVAVLLLLGVLPLGVACAGPLPEASTGTASEPPPPDGGLRSPSLAPMGVERVFPALSFARMTNLTHAGDGTGRLFVTLQPGLVMAFVNEPGTTEAATFLDIRGRVNDQGNEEGLLGIAFDPGYAKNGYVYLYYAAAGPRRSVLSRFLVPPGAQAADPASERILLEIPQPFANHNGGQLAFGPDGYLYVGVGDGGSAGDPLGNGQDRSTLLGTILRLDVGVVDAKGSYGIPEGNPFLEPRGQARPEIWAYGLRNPWRFSFDPETGDLWAGDVGQNRQEEVDLIEPGRNYGWNVTEGTSCFSPRTGCSMEGLAPPVATYGRAEGCSVTGGYVYRGARLPSLYGAYVYGDYCSGRVWALRLDGGAVVEHRELVDSALRISSFGVDASDELYLLSFDGKIYRLVER